MGALHKGDEGYRPLLHVGDEVAGPGPTPLNLPSDQQAYKEHSGMETGSPTYLQKGDKGDRPSMQRWDEGDRSSLQSQP